MGNRRTSIRFSGAAAQGFIEQAAQAHGVDLGLTTPEAAKPCPICETLIARAVDIQANTHGAEAFLKAGDWNHDADAHKSETGHDALAQIRALTPR